MQRGASDQSISMAAAMGSLGWWGLALLLSLMVLPAVVSYRALHRVLPLRLQHGLRDSGALGALVDSATLVTAAMALSSRPKVAWRLATATSRGALGVAYGPLGEHRMDVFHAGASDTTPLIVFIHGGAWGSGSRLIYRLFGLRLADEGCVCAVVGYRRYPQTRMEGLLSDVERALEWLRGREDWRRRKVVVVGHSSGAHLAVLLSLRRALQGQPPLADTVCGLCGVYDIGPHYDFEAGRGVHEVSPMKPCAGGPEQWDAHSPRKVCRHLSGEHVRLLPRMVLAHGREDATVPWTSTALMADALADAGAGNLVECAVVDRVGHADVVTELSLEPARTSAEFSGMARIALDLCR